VLPEVPSAEPRREISRERWEHWLRGPRVNHEAILLAVAGDRVVAYANLSTHPQRPGEANHDITAVHPEFRRRGVARALKATQIAWARQHGIERLRTQNDLTNQPIRRLNDELGYTPLPARITLRARVDP
jgi:mycothiol synthase